LELPPQRIVRGVPDADLDQSKEMDVYVVHGGIVVDEPLMALKRIEPNLVLWRHVIWGGPSTVEGSVSLVLDLTGIPRSVRDQDSMTTGDTYLRWAWIPSTTQNGFQSTDRMAITNKEAIIVGSAHSWEKSIGHIKCCG